MVEKTCRAGCWIGIYTYTPPGLGKAPLNGITRWRLSRGWLTTKKLGDPARILRNAAGQWITPPERKIGT